MFWLRTKKTNFQLHTLIWGPDHLNILDAKLSEKGVRAIFVLCFDVAEPGNHGAVVMLQAVQGLLSCLYCLQHPALHICNF